MRRDVRSVFASSYCVYARTLGNIEASGICYDYKYDSPVRLVIVLSFGLHNFTETRRCASVFVVYNTMVKRLITTRFVSERESIECDSGNNIVPCKCHFCMKKKEQNTNARGARGGEGERDT